MRNRVLHDQMHGFAESVREHLNACVEAGAEIPFEVAESPGATSVLYHYRPLSSDFVRARFDELRTLEGIGAVLDALSKVEGTGGYLRALGAGELPASERERAEAVLKEFLARLWDEVTSFELDDQRFERTYRELESVLYEDSFVATVVAPLLGVRLADERWELDSEISLARGDLCDAPAESVWAAGREEREPNTLAVLAVEVAPQDPPPLTAARVAFRKLLTTLRLFKPGPVALGQTAWWRVDDGPWQAVPLAFSGRLRAGSLWLESAERSELAELYGLIRARPLEGGALPWALARFEMGCERSVPVEGLSDHLLALRALLHGGEGTSVEISSRVAALCAEPPRRAAVKQTVEQAFRLERQLMRGNPDADYFEATGTSPPDALSLEVEGLLRAIVRDVVCGYLDPNVKRLADELIRAETNGTAEPRIRRPTPKAEPSVDSWEEVASASSPSTKAVGSKSARVVSRAREMPPPPAEEMPRSSGEETPPDEARPPHDSAGDEPAGNESEQATEESLAVEVGPEAEDAEPEWGFDDDDPSDYSAAV